MFRVLLVCALILSLLGVGRADQRRALARGHFMAGQAHFVAGRYSAAMQEFKLAYDIAPFPELIFNIARCQEELHDLPGALATYERYLPLSPSTERRSIERRIADLRQAGVEPAPVPVWAEAASPPPPTPTRSRHHRWIWPTVAAVLVTGAAVGLGVGLTIGRAPVLTYEPVRP